MVSGQIVNGQVQSTYTETDQTKKKSRKRCIPAVADNTAAVSGSVRANG